VNTLVFDAADEQATDRFGAALAETVPSGATLALTGTLGAGKTRLVQAIAAACGIDRAEVVSPTFILCQRYEGRRTIYHLDAYRLKDEDEFCELGPEEFFDAGALTIVEWADKVAACLPDERLEIDIAVTGPNSRRFTVRAADPALQPVVASLRSRLTDR
jgi:tRNA threonylcarbamoyladenosine biosynthesis protein TsaE